MILRGSFAKIYTKIDTTMHVTTIPRLPTPVTDITLVFYCHMSNKTGPTDVECGSYNKSGMTVLDVGTPKCQTERGCGCKNAGKD